MRIVIINSIFKYLKLVKLIPVELRQTSDAGYLKGILLVLLHEKIILKIIVGYRLKHKCTGYDFLD